MKYIVPLFHKMSIRLSFQVFFGGIINRLPYAVVPVIGRVYRKYWRMITKFDNLNSDEQLLYVFNKTKSMVEYAEKSIPFYQKLYRENGFDSTQLNNFEDLRKIPIVTKDMLMEVSIPERSNKLWNCYLANTGGSTGKPLSFYKTKDLKVKESAYFHYIWSSLGYNRSDLRLHFVGRGGNSNIISYNLIEHSIQVSVYTRFEVILEELSELKCEIKFLHGYPSVLYEFALHCEQHPTEFEKSGINRTLKGVFFKSEYPYPIYRRKIEEVFKVKTLSHYGHTEVCALAYEKEIAGRYNVLQSYGYVETLNKNGEHHLIATSYDNFASPLIRYDTEDIATSVCYDGALLSSFQIEGGRGCEYILDKKKKKISLTGVIFGNHHELFNFCKQIQVSQVSPGTATIYYVPKAPLPADFEPSNYFNMAGIDVDFNFRQIDEPIKTPIGKILLKIDER